MSPILFSRWLAAACAAVALTACGGGDGAGSAGTGTGSTAATTSTKELASGTVTGFGSVIVDGVKYDDRSASVSVEQDAASPKAGSVSALRLGMRVEVGTRDGTTVDTVAVRSEVVGRITSLSADGFVVAGQNVKRSGDPATVFDGVAGLSGLVVNDLVEVHGQRDAAGNIVASRIERKDPNSTPFVRVVGNVGALDSTAKTFTVGGLTVSYDSATRILPAGTQLANGLRVAVWSNGAISGNTLAARTIVVRSSGLGESDKARIGGLISGLDFAARAFTVDNVRVDASNAQFEDGSATDLANGRPVRVRGTFTDGVLVASEVKFAQPRGDMAPDLSGPITDFVSSASFKVRGVPVDASAATVAFAGGDASNLADGVVVRVVGSVEANVVKATSVSFVNTADGRLRAFAGVVSGYASGSGAFRLMGTAMTLGSSATFRNASGTTATRADFGDGDRVVVRGSFVAGVFTVTEVLFLDTAGRVVDRAGGAIYAVNLGAGTFTLNGTVVRVNDATVFVGGTRADLADGLRVEVAGVVSGGELLARSVRIQAPVEGMLAEARGEITDFVSAADFRVAGQRVDASAASFRDGSVASLAEGRFVEAKGPVVGGVLKATSVEFR